MSKSSKLFLGLLTVCLALSLVLGLTYSVKKTEEIKDENYAYAVLLTDLKTELNYNIENVTELQKDLVLKGLELEDLQKVVTVYETKIETLTETVTEYEEIIVEKEKVITEKETEVETLTETVTEYEERIVYLEGSDEDKSEEIEALQAEIDRLQALLEARNAEIEDLKSQKETVIVEKTVVETELVEVKEDLQEAETTIEEKDEEIAQLTVNVNVLNETIIELNVKIELLEEALEKDDTKTYIKEFFDSVFYTYILDENSALISTDNSVLLVNTIDYSCEKLVDTGNALTKKYLFGNGNVMLICGGFSSNYGLFCYNVETSAYSFDDYSGCEYFGTLANGDVIVGQAGGWGIHRIDCEDFSKNLIEDTSGLDIASGNMCFIGAYPETNDALFSVSRTDEYGGIYYYTYETDSITKVSEYNTLSFVESSICLEDKNIFLISTNDELISVDMSSYEVNYLYYYGSSPDNYYTCYFNNVSVNNNVILYLPTGEGNESFHIIYDKSSGLSFGIDSKTFNFSVDYTSFDYGYYRDNVNHVYTNEDGFYLFNKELGIVTNIYSISNACDYTTKAVSGDFIVLTSTKDETLPTLYFNKLTNLITEEIPSKLTVVNEDTCYYFNDGMGNRSYYKDYDSYGELTLDKTEVYVGETITVSYSVASGRDLMGVYYQTSANPSDGYPVYDYVRISLDENNQFKVTEDMIVDGAIYLTIIVEDV